MRKSKELQVKERTEKWLDERYQIMNMEDPQRQADVSYYHGAIKAVEFLGYEWRRDENGKHIINKY